MAISTEATSTSPTTPAATVRAGQRPASWKRRWGHVFSLDPRTLAVTRMAVALVLLGNLISRARDLTAMYTDQGLLPREVLRDFHRHVGDWFWSLHALGGSSLFAASLFLLAGLLAMALLVGYRTFWATLLSWLLLVSLHQRMPLLVTGGDVLLSMLLFWAIFLPWGDCWSLDARRRAIRWDKEQRVLTPASAAILLQVALMYLLTGIGKCNEFWWSGEAIHNALSYDMIARPLGRELLQFPQLLKLLTWSTLALELAAPLLLFCPWGTRYTRPLAWAGLVALHLGIELTMRVTVFSFASLAALTLFLTPWFWQLGWVRAWLDRKNTAGNGSSASGEKHAAAPPKGDSRRVRGRRLGHLAVLLLAGYVFLFNMGWQLGGDRFLSRIPQPLYRLTEAAGFVQRWTMFLRPQATDFRFAAVARLNNGQVVDVFRDGAAVEWNEADSWSAEMPSQRWMLAFRELSEDRNNWFRHSAARYFVERWNARHAPERHVELLDLLMVQVKPWLPGPSGPPMIRLAQVDARARGPMRNGKRHGRWELLHDDGSLAARGSYENGQRHGPWELFHPNGQLAARGPYRDDLEHGDWVHYFADGRKEAAGRYDQGRMDGRWTFWYEDGSRLETVYRDGLPVPAAP